MFGERIDRNMQPLAKDFGIIVDFVTGLLCITRLFFRKLILTSRRTLFLKPSLEPRDISKMDVPDAPPDPPPPTNGTTPHDSKGWDGKLRVDRRAVVTNAEILSDPEYSDEDAPPVEQIDADEGRYKLCFLGVSANSDLIMADLLEDYELDTDVCYYYAFVLLLRSVLTYFLGLGHRPCPLPHLLHTCATP